MRIVRGTSRDGIFFKISYFDSPNMPPIGMPGLDAVKKTKDRARSDSHIQYRIAGNCTIPKGQYSHLFSLMKKLVLIIIFQRAIRASVAFSECN
jgi:hypothetical protein